MRSIKERYWKANEPKTLTITHPPAQTGDDTTDGGESE